MTLLHRAKIVFYICITSGLLWWICHDEQCWNVVNTIIRKISKMRFHCFKIFILQKVSMQILAMIFSIGIV